MYSHPRVCLPADHRPRSTPARALAVALLIGLLSGGSAGGLGGGVGGGLGGGLGDAAATSAAVEGGTERHPRWQWPVDGPRVAERPFLAPPTPYGAGHRGVDLAAGIPGPSGTPLVRAPVGGVVHFAGRVVDRGVVTVRTGPLLVTLEPVTPSVVVGDAVTAGQVLGSLEPGHCPSSPCVHLGVREAGHYLSPMKWLGGLQRAVLLPLRATDG